MIEAGYPWGEAFQIRLLAFLLKDPERVLNIIEPGFFTDPITTDIARVIRDLYKRQEGEYSISKTTLKELVKEGLGKKKEHWNAYREVIHQIYKTKLKDKNVLFDQALEFARETKYRDALVKAERDITAKRYDAVRKRIEEAETWLATKISGQSRSAAVTLPTLYFHQLLRTEFDTGQEYLVDVIVPRGGAILSFGLPKGLKSWFSTAVALDAAIGDGQALGYFKTPRPVKVLLVQVEDPARRIKERLQKLREARLFHQDPRPGNLSIITRCPLNLLDRKWMAELERVIEEQGSELVIFDVFRRLFRGNVNSPEDTAAFLEAVDGLRDRYGVAIWIVHHSNKKSESEMMTKALGSINLTAWGDVLLYFKNKEESDHITSCNLEIETKDQAIDGELRVVLDDEAEPMLRVEEARLGHEKLQKAASQLPPEWTILELANATDLKYAGAYKQLQEWLQQGSVLEVSRGSKGHPARYRLAENSKNGSESESE